MSTALCNEQSVLLPLPMANQYPANKTITTQKPLPPLLLCTKNLHHFLYFWG